MGPRVNAHAVRGNLSAVFDPWPHFAVAVQNPSSLLERKGRFYNFVHEHARLFDGYQPAASVAVIINGDVDNFTLFEGTVELLRGLSGYSF